MDDLYAQRPPSVRCKDRTRGATVLQINRYEMLVKEKMKIAIDSLKMIDRIGISLILEKLREDVLNEYFKVNTPQLCQRYGDYLAEIGAVHQLKTLMERLNNLGKYTKDWWIGMNIVRTILCNYSNSSMKMAKEIGKSGILEMFVNEMKILGQPALNDEKLKILITYAIDILHNCAKATENLQVLRDIKVTQAVEPFLQAEKSDVVIPCLFIIAYIIDNNQAYLLRIDCKTIKTLLKILRDSIYGSETPSESGSWSVDEILKGIAVISKHEENAHNFITLGGIALLIDVINYCQDIESECAVNALWTLCKTDYCRKIINDYPNLMKTLENLSKHTNRHIGAAAKRVLLKIKQDSMEGFPRKYCEYQQACTMFLTGLDLLDEFFEAEYDKCYCTDCHASRHEELHGVQGHPAKCYGIPIGWNRFGLKVAPPAKAFNADTDWHVAYHGTSAFSVKKILECGQLLIPGDTALGGKQLSEVDGHFTDDNKPGGFNTKQVFVSPSIRYSGLEVFAKTERFDDPQTKKPYKATVVFQLWIKPDSYKVGPQTVGAADEIDPKFSNQEIEWATVQRGAIHFYGLLVRLEE